MTVALFLCTRYKIKKRPTQLLHCVKFLAQMVSHCSQIDQTDKETTVIYKQMSLRVLVKD